MVTINYKQLKQKTFSDGKAEDKIDIYPVIGFDESAFTGSQTVILPVEHGGTGSNDVTVARANLKIPEKLSELKSELIGNTNDSKAADTINGAKNYAKDQADLILKTIQGDGFDTEDLQNLKALSDTLKDDSNIITTIQASIEDRVKKTNIYTYDENGDIVGGGKVGNGAYTLSGGAVGKGAISSTGFAGGLSAYVGSWVEGTDGELRKDVTTGTGGAIGENAEAVAGFAGGKDAKAKGKNSIAIGTEANAENPEAEYDALNTSISIGYKTQATDKQSIAIGVGAQARGFGSIAIGASKSNGVADSDVTRALNQESIAIGLNAVATGAGSIQLGANYGTGQTEPNTLNFRQYEIVNAKGRIPSARLYEVVSTLPESATNGTIVFLRQQTT